MKHIFALGTAILSGALLASACVASDEDDDPDTSQNVGGAGGTGGNGGSGADGNTVNTATSSGGNGGGTTAATGGSGGTYSSGGSGGEAGMAAGGWAGEQSGEESTTGWQTTGGGGEAGASFECLGDDEVDDLPDCMDLEYAEVVCDEFDPPEPFGMTHCKQFAEHATPEAFAAMFECLDEIDEDDACGEAHDEAVRVCRDDADTGVVSLTCESALAVEKCANLGCPEIDTEPGEECDVYLSTFTPAGVDHVIACANDNTSDEPGGTWGAGPDTTGCGDVFLGCVAGLLQPTH